MFTYDTASFSKCPSCFSALMLLEKTPVQIIVTGNPKTNPATSGFLSAIQTMLLPQKVVVVADGNQESILYKSSKILSNIAASGTSKEPGHSPMSLKLGLIVNVSIF